MSKSSSTPKAGFLIGFDDPESLISRAKHFAKEFCSIIRNTFATLTDEARGEFACAIEAAGSTPIYSFRSTSKFQREPGRSLGPPFQNSAPEWVR